MLYVLVVEFFFAAGLGLVSLMCWCFGFKGVTLQGSGLPVRFGTQGLGPIKACIM